MGEEIGDEAGGEKGRKEFKDYEEARKEVEEEFLETISLFRAKRHVADSKLEVHYGLNEKGVAQAYLFVGKIKFSDKTLIERDGEETLTEEYIGVLEYLLRPEMGKKDEKTQHPKERWVLENVLKEEGYPSGPDEDEDE